MKLKVLVYKTNVSVLSHLGELRYGKGGMCIVSPQNPGWFWGTFMVRSAPPVPGCLAAWEAEYDELIAETPGIAHRTIAWDVPQSSLDHTDQFVEAGYERYESVTLLLDEPDPAAPNNPALLMRPLKSDEDWAQVLELQTLVAKEKYHAGTGDFKQPQMRDYRILTQRGIGEWWGAWYEGKLVADMGIYACEDGLSCLQLVETHPDYRRRGFSRQLMCEVTRFALGPMQARSVVIQAEAGTNAERFYRKAGGRLSEYTVELRKELPVS